MPARINYEAAFRELLDAVSDGQRIPFREIVAAPQFGGVGEATVKKHFKAFVDANPTCLTRITGFYPMPETIIALVEAAIGSITELNLYLANVRSSRIETFC